MLKVCYITVLHIYTVILRVNSSIADVKQQLDLSTKYTFHRRIIEVLVSVTDRDEKDDRVVFH